MGDRGSPPTSTPPETAVETPRPSPATARAASAPPSVAAADPQPGTQHSSHPGPAAPRPGTRVTRCRQKGPRQTRALCARTYSVSQPVPRATLLGRPTGRPRRQEQPKTARTCSLFLLLRCLRVPQRIPLVPDHDPDEGEQHHDRRQDRELLLLHHQRLDAHRRAGDQRSAPALQPREPHQQPQKRSASPARPGQHPARQLGVHDHGITSLDAQSMVRADAAHLTPLASPARTTTLPTADHGVPHLPRRADRHPLPDRHHRPLHTLAHPSLEPLAGHLLPPPRRPLTSIVGSLTRPTIQANTPTETHAAPSRPTGSASATHKPAPVDASEVNPTHAVATPKRSPTNHRPIKPLPISPKT